jgi:hypothetical protein
MATPARPCEAAALTRFAVADGAAAGLRLAGLARKAWVIALVIDLVLVRIADRVMAESVRPKARLKKRLPARFPIFSSTKK